MDETRGINVRKALKWGGLSVALSFAGVFLVLHMTRSQNIVRNVLQVGLRTLAAAGGLVIASWVADGARMAVLARGMGGDIFFWYALRVSMMGSFMAGVTPFDTGGEPLKVYFLHKKGMSVGQATASVTMAAMLHATARFIVWALLPLVALTFGFSWRTSTAGLVTMTAGLVLYVFFLILFVLAVGWPETMVVVADRICRMKLLGRFVGPERMAKLTEKIRTAAGDFREGVVKIRKDGAVATLSLALSIAYWLFLTGVPVFILKSMGSTLSPFQILSLSMTVYLVMAYTPTPGASGGAEVGSAVFFSPFLPARILGTFVIVWRVVTHYLTLVTGGVLVAIETIRWSAGKANLPR